MGTSIKIEAVKGENTTVDQWNTIVECFSELFQDVEFDDTCVTSGIIYTSYGHANIENQIPEEVRDTLKGSEININLWFEEREPDEEETL